MNSGFGAVTSYSADQEEVEEQRKPPPILVKLTTGTSVFIKLS